MEPPTTLPTGIGMRRSRLSALPEHFAMVEDPRDERRILHPLPEIAAQGADWLLAVKVNQPTLRTEVEAAFATTEPARTHTAHDKGHGRIKARHTAVLHDTDWLAGSRRFPGEMRLRGAACLIRAITEVEAGGRKRRETRYFISSRSLTPNAAAEAVREHRAIGNRLHRVLDVTFGDDQSRLRKRNGARNMATVRHFALNLVRTPTDRRSLKSRRKISGWDTNYLQKILSTNTD